MRRVRLGIIGAGTATEWAILPVLSGPDAVAPPDTGVWWGRRPGARSDIAYQPPARPEVVALADTDFKNVTRLAEAARVRAVYGDWRAMLREVPLDALLCAASPALASEVILELVKSPAAPRRVWIYGPPAPSFAALRQAGERLAARSLHVWPARPLRQAAAHRAARQLMERDEIGPVAALHLRWTMPLQVPAQAPLFGAERDSDVHLASAYAALDCLLGFAASGAQATGGGSAVPVQVLASEHLGATTLWLRCANGVNATAIFAGAENWSSPLPRLEICGTQGRSIVCEAGRRLWLHRPHEAARLLEPPGLAAHVSQASVAGLAEDLKAFIAACSEDGTGAGAALVAAPSLGWTGAERALRLLEAARQSLDEGGIIEIAGAPEPGAPLDTPEPDTSEPVGRAARVPKTEPPATLPLQL